MVHNILKTNPQNMSLSQFGAESISMFGSRAKKDQYQSYCYGNAGFCESSQRTLITKVKLSNFRKKGQKEENTKTDSNFSQEEQEIENLRTIWSALMDPQLYISAVMQALSRDIVTP